MARPTIVLEHYREEISNLYQIGNVPSSVAKLPSNQYNVQVKIVRHGLLKCCIIGLRSLCTSWPG